ncbi:hypothetical protein DPMN_186629 [Dreissena polymorpha]|uniref:Uncharacterized protein n=1 Tax=Dreissena polymorpha TaxID=45954 RepID=A0A9D4I6P3_DREPO|nr:hypothetical protein DPMN_186629 [Dreissena polymorpha]
MFTPKENNSKNIDEFRTITLLNVEGKISLLSSPEDLRLTSQPTSISTPLCRREAFPVSSAV